MKFYSMEKILEQHAEYNIIYGGRAAGKSYAMAKELLRDYIDNGAEFVRLIRSYSYSAGLNTYFQEVIENEKLDVRVTYDHFNYYIDGEPFGYVFPLTMEHTKKSAQFPRVRNVLLEEFVAPCAMDYADGDPDLELEHFASALSTIFRHRSGRVFLIGNNMETSNPYFEYFGINGVQLRKGSLKVFQGTTEINGEKIPGARIAVEFVPIGYEKPDEVPVMMRIPNNQIATTGDTQEGENIATNITAIYSPCKGAFIGLDVPAEKLAFIGTFENYIAFYITGEGWIITPNKDGLEGRKAERVKLLPLTEEKKAAGIAPLVWGDYMSDEARKIERTYNRFVDEWKNHGESDKPFNSEPLEEWAPALALDPYKPIECKTLQDVINYAARYTEKKKEGWERFDPESFDRIRFIDNTTEWTYNSRKRQEEKRRRTAAGLGLKIPDISRGLYKYSSVSLYPEEDDGADFGLY